MFFSLLLIIVFGGIVGWTASITRAAIVSGLGLVMWYVGRKFEAWRIILIAMATTLLMNPMYIINLGWLLSFASFIGIMIISPEIQKYFFFEGKILPKKDGKIKISEKISGKIAEIFVTTISATIMCAPILLYFFGSLSIISPIANLLILPTVAIAMGLTFFSGIFSPILPIFSIVFGKFAEIVLKYHIFVMEFFAEQKFFLIKIPAECPWVFLIYLVLIAIFLARKISEREERKKMER